jgi:hypothetical protein
MRSDGGVICAASVPDEKSAASASVRTGLGPGFENERCGGTGELEIAGNMKISLRQWISVQTLSLREASRRCKNRGQNRGL